MSQLVLMDQDGAIDDFLSTILLMTMDEVEPLGVVVTPADCYIGAAVNVTRKMLDLLERSDVPVAASTLRGLNPFPAAFRRDCIVVDHFPILNQREKIATPLVAESGQDFMVNTLLSAPRPVTLMVTGPLTNVAYALDADPQIEPQIERIVWMGGALQVGGNVEKVFAPEHDGSAEWNAYWDPPAVERVWRSRVAITLCPLDITNTVPVTAEFIRCLSRQRQYPISDLAGLCYALALPQDYYCWDILATAYLAHPGFYQTKVLPTRVVTAGVSQGRIRIDPDGRMIHVLEEVDRVSFFNYLLDQWQR